jgi:hypothetical protein
MNAEPGTGLSRGEAKIRRAFVISALVIVIAAVAAALGWWLGTDRATPVTVEEADIQTPVVPAAATAGAGGADPSVPPDVTFTDITSAAGIDFVHVNGAYGERLMPETIGSGAAFFDYDNDGDQDLLLVNSREWAGHETLDAQPTQRLYRNDGSGRFEDVTEAAGLDLTAYGMGVAVGDIDGDGRRDIVISCEHATPPKSGVVWMSAGGTGPDATWRAREISGPAGIKFDRIELHDVDCDGDLDVLTCEERHAGRGLGVIWYENPR